MAKKTEKKPAVKKGRLSNKDFETFKKNIHLSDEELAKKLNRTVQFIEKTRQRVYPNKKTGKWNAADITMLEENMDKMSVEQLARLLNRTEKAVESKLESYQEVEIVVEEPKGIDADIELEVMDIEIEPGFSEAVMEAETIAENLNEKIGKEVSFTGADSKEKPSIETIGDEECCGQNCCDHIEVEVEVEVEAEPVKEEISWWKKFINFFKFW